MYLFELRNITRRYGQRVVLNLENLSLEEGQIYAVLGPNGAGKTTLLRLLNLLDKPDSGDLIFAGQNVYANGTNRVQLARQMSMVFQRPFMFKGSVYQNVAYGLKLRKMPPQEIDARVRESVEFVGMSSFLKKPANRLSGGETQRIALARSLALRPRVLLLDEPTANLDPTSVQGMEEIIRNCRRELGMSVIIVTHNIFQAQRIADQALLLMDGSLMEAGPAQQFFKKPSQTITRQFLDGTMVY